MGTCLGCSQDLGQVYSEREQLATPTPGLWEEWGYCDQVPNLLL